MARTTSLIYACVSFLLLAGVCGCPSMEPIPTQAPIQEFKDSRSGQPYLLYVPSRYSDRRAWPLLVLCHGTWPYDTASHQMREWAGYAESNGLIVAAPTLEGTRGDFPPEPSKQVELQQRDERLILDMVAALKGRYQIAEEQVFLTGWSAGAYAILYTGLRHPDVFRALAVRQGSFDPRFMEIPPDLLDKWQPILVIYGRMDFLRDQTRTSIQWLRDLGMFVEAEEVTGSHRRIEPRFVWRFFSTVMRERPCVRIRGRAVEAENPLKVQFDLFSTPPAERQKWFFGDGEESRDAAPIHTYGQPGRYEVLVNVVLKGGKKYTRKRVVFVDIPPP